MNAEEIADELFDIMCDENYVEEPAGRGCGYGFTEDGQAEILAVIKRILPQSRKDSIMSTIKEQKAFEVTIVEKTDNIIAATNVIQGIKRKFHLNREPIIALSATAARSKAERKLTKKMTDSDAETFIDSLEVKVEAVNFPG